MHEIVRGLINWLVSGLMEGTVAAASGLADVDAGSRASATGGAFLARNRRWNCAAEETYCEERSTNPSGWPRIAGESIGAHRERCSSFSWRTQSCLPVNYLEESAGQPLHRRVCDYIAGMTDGFLRSQDRAPR